MKPRPSGHWNLNVSGSAFSVESASAFAVESAPAGDAVAVSKAGAVSSSGASSPDATEADGMQCIDYLLGAMFQRLTGVLCRLAVIFSRLFLTPGLLFISFIPVSCMDDDGLAV